MKTSRPPSILPWVTQPIVGCPCGRVHEPGLRDVILAPGAIDAIPDLLPPPQHGDGPLLLVGDPETWDAAGGQVRRTLVAARRPVREAILPRDPHADDLEIERLLPVLSYRPSRVLAVGSGTISDLGKVLAHEGGVPLMTVGTAASMNGYASPIAALTLSGLKVTKPVPAPDLLVLDLEVLQRAPLRLTRAGFGDLCSKPVSSADWLLSAYLFGETVCPTALSLADTAVAAARSHAAGIGRRETDAVAALAEALVLSGISMHVAGASSPASGGEHLLSHYLDISADGWRRYPHLHGEQVAVGTLASLALYRRIRDGLPPQPDSPGPIEPSEAALRSMHGHLAGPALAGLIQEARAKIDRVPQRRERRGRLAVGWLDLWERLDEQLRSSRDLRADLAAAGVPCTWNAIEVPRDMAARLPLLAPHMRNRYTVLDLAADLGRLDVWAEEIADELAA